MDSQRILFTLSASVVLACSAISCSHGGSNDAPAGPVATINSKISSSASGALTGGTAIFEASRAAGGQPANGGTSLIMKRFLNSTLGFSSIDNSAVNPQDRVRAKTEALSNVIQNGSCQLSVTPVGDPSSIDGTMMKPMQVKISGSACAVLIDMTITMTNDLSSPPEAPTSGAPSASKLSAVVKMTYQVNDANLARQMEVSSGHVNMNFDMDQELSAPTGDPSHQPNSMTMSMKGKGNFDLKAVDLQGQANLISGNQDIDIKMTMAQNAQQASSPQIFGGFRESLQYLQQATGAASNLSSSVVANGGSTALETYLVDGIPVTKEAYKSERDKFANSMMATQIGNAASSGKK